ALRIHSPFEAIGSLRADSCAACAAPDASGGELCALEEKIHGSRGDLGLGAAHDACERDRTFPIGDHEILGGKLACLSIERHESLPGMSAAHFHDPSPECREIESMEGLPELVQDEVRHIDHIADRAHTDRLEPAPQPVGRWPDAYPANNPRDVLGTAGRILHLDPHML